MKSVPTDYFEDEETDPDVLADLAQEKADRELDRLKAEEDA